jgi:inhibitor of KinA sporulation pathway (predicted exonuclease)
MALNDYYDGTVVLLDAEFTCWEGSLASGWSDPKHPAEMIEIGMIAYDANRQIEIASFTSLIKPRVNPILSDYCLNILPIIQPDVDSAKEFESVMSEISDWLNHHVSPDSPTAAWGKIDRTHTTKQSERNSVSDPFGTRTHIEVDELVKTALDITTQIEREDVRMRLNIEPITGRHRALADSADLIAFDLALARINK